MPSYTVNVVGGGLISTADVSSKASIIKSAFALDQLNNTSDAGKPVTTAVSNALTSFVNNSAIGEALNNPPVLEFNFKEDQYVTKNPAVAAGTLINSKTGPAAEFSRASGATYKDHIGMIRFAPENLTLYSYSFQNAVWTSGLSYVSLTDSFTTDPFGVSLNASKITQTTDSVSQPRHIHEATGPYEPTIGLTYCMSVYIKQHETDQHRYFQLTFWSGGFGSSAFKNFDIQAKAVSSGEGGTSIIAAGIETLQNGWMRIWATAPATASTLSGFQLAFVSSLSAARAESYVLSSGAKSAYIHGAQVERSTYPRAYLSTTSSKVYGPRFHYDFTNNTSLGLIFEAQKTNYGHNVLTNNSNTTVTANYSGSTAPDGSYTATRVQSTPNQSSTFNYITYDTIGDGQYTRSFFVKALGNSAAFVMTSNEGSGGLIIKFDVVNKQWYIFINNGTYNITYGYEEYGDGWIRVWITSLKDSTHELNGQFWLGWWGTGGIQQDMLFWGAQVEDGYVMTSYIPNSLTQSLIRTADSCAITGTNFSTFYNQNEGTLCVDYRSIQYGSRYNIAASFTDGTNNNRIYIGTSTGNNSSSNTDTEFTFSSGVSGTLQYGGTTNTSQGVLRKCSFAYSTNTCGAYINGIALTPTTNLTTKIPPIVNRMNIGSDNDVMNISSLRYYNKRLSNSTLQTVTLL